MTDLRKAAEQALEALEGYPLPFQAPIKEALRQALAQPVDAVNMSQERVDETAKREHEPWCDSVTKLLLSMPPQIPPCNCKPKREWVGLTDEEVDALLGKLSLGAVDEDVRTIEAKLKEKNT